MTPILNLGARYTLDSRKNLGAYGIPAHDLLTHGVIVGMTGSGKTGLLTVLVEEVLSAQVPCLLIDVKGDLANLALALPSFDPSAMAPWVEADAGDDDGIADPPVVASAVETRRKGLASWNIDEAKLAAYAKGVHVRVITPGSEAGEPLHLLSALEQRSTRWDGAPDAARAGLSAAVSLVLRLTGRDADPGRSREHALLSVLAERRLSKGGTSTLGELMADLNEPPITQIGDLELDAFVSPKLRAELAADLNTLVASPSFASWRRGQSIDVGAWMKKVDGRTPATIVSVAHLDDAEKQLVLGVVLEEVLSWVRSQPGSSRLKALVAFDEVYGFVPPHPANPPTKRPIVALMKQARAFGVGCVIATQNPMDLDYRALSNAGTWMLGRLQTDADRARVVEGLGEDKKKSVLAGVLKKLGPRWFVVREAKDNHLTLLNPRWAMSYLRGPMTGRELARLREATPCDAVRDPS